MNLKKRLVAVGVIVLVAAITYGIAKSGREITMIEEEEPVFTGGKETLYLWYTDEVLTSYLSSAAVTYNESHDVRIVPVLESGLEYLENINRASLSEENIPDMYILSHDSLEKAYLAGLAHEVEQEEEFSLADNYMQTGLHAAAYKDKIIAYPFYFETSSLLYNKTYLEEIARNQLQAEADVLAAEEAQANAPAAGSSEAEAETESTEGTDAGETVIDEQEVQERVEELLPATLEDIKAFADNYDAPEQVEAVFKWDVTDIFYNYFFIGDAINMGGEAGWDVTQIDIYNENAINSMRAYEELNQFFSIDTSAIDYESVIDEFISGKLVFTVATSDVVAKLEQAKEDGLFAYDYGITLTPDINEEMKTRSLSVTQCVVINGYSEHLEEANDFARFLTSEYNDILYARTGKVSAAQAVDYGYEALNEFAREYENSISMPKMIETSNFWVQLEVTFSQVWNGADANEKLKELSEQIMQQVTGRAYEEEYIEETKEEEEIEYLDEEYYMQEDPEEE